MKNSIGLLVISFLLLMQSGCAYKAGYNPTYIPDENPEYFSSENVLLFMEDEEEKFVFTGNPTSLTGSATTLTLPLGFIIKEVSEEVLEDRFSGGVGFSNDIKENLKYEVIFHPSLKRFEFRFNPPCPPCLKGGDTVPAERGPCRPLRRDHAGRED